MAGTGNGRFGSLGMPDLGGVPELVVLSAASETHDQGLSVAGGGSGHRADFGRAAGHVRVSAHSRLAHSGRDSDQPQDRVAYSSAEGLAFLHAEPFGEDPTAARGAGERAGSESEMGLGHHGHCDLEQGKGASGGYHRLRRPDGAGLAVRPADAFGRIARDGSGSGVWTVRSRERKSSKHRVLIGQRTGVRLPEAPWTSPRLRDGGMPDSPLQPRIQRAGRGFLRKLQAGLRLSGGIGEPGSGGPTTAGMDQRLQRGSSAQRPGDEVPGAILCGLDVKNKHYTCADLGGAVHSIVRTASRISFKFIRRLLLSRLI